ncbi:hypothetical protein WN944_026655 [Citrus x changshan-huyou]|uniref:UBN2 domain-containing protein n=1 Tax=Citrus x changshan-huyou TaxID=2935761 RepID=A0AAP0LS06_9ROSI
MDIDYAIRKDEPLINDNITEVDIALYEKWERSNRLSVMFIKTKISAAIRGSVDQHNDVRALLKAIDEQFVTSDKTLASTLIMKFSSMKLTSIRGVREHIMQMRDIAAQLKLLEAARKALRKEHRSGTEGTAASIVACGEFCSAGTVSQGLRFENVLIRRMFLRYTSRSSLVRSGGNSRVAGELMRSITGAASYPRFNISRNGIRRIRRGTIST